MGKKKPFISSPPSTQHLQMADYCTQRAAEERFKGNVEEARRYEQQASHFYNVSAQEKNGLQIESPTNA